MIPLLVLLAFVVVIIAGCWKVFTKAGKPGWAVIIPFYNLYVMLTIAGKPGWWIILFFIPFVSLIMSILMCLALADKFGKGAGFGIGLAFLPFIFFPMLGFGSAQYKGTAAS